MREMRLEKNRCPHDRTLFLKNIFALRKKVQGIITGSYLQVVRSWLTSYFYSFKNYIKKFHSKPLLLIFIKNGSKNTKQIRGTDHFEKDCVCFHSMC